MAGGRTTCVEGWLPAHPRVRSSHLRLTAQTNPKIKNKNIQRMFSGISFWNFCIFLSGISAQKLILANIACCNPRWPGNGRRQLGSKSMRPSLFAHYYVCTCLHDAAQHLCLERDQSGLLRKDAGAWSKSGCDFTFDVLGFSNEQDLLDPAGKCQKRDKIC